MGAFLVFFLSLVPVNLVWNPPSCVNPDILGQFIVKTETIEICERNIIKTKFSVDTIVKHELVHYFYHRKGNDQPLIPEPLFTHLVRKTVSSEEAMTVILSQTDYSTSEEFHARLLDDLPNFVFFIFGVGFELCTP